MRRRKAILRAAVVVLIASTAAIAWAYLADGPAEILFVRSDGVYVMSADGKNVRRIGSNGRDAVWSPDGAKVAFAVRTLELGGDASSDIVVMDADGGHRRLLATGDEPVWSPDGTMIAFTREWDAAVPFSSVWVMDVDGGNQRLLARGESPAWSPDGNWLAYVSEEDVNVVSASGGPSRVLATALGARELTWSPDGRQVLAEAHEGLVALRSDGSRVRTIDPNGGDAIWSPDGKSIAYERSGRCLLSSLYLASLDGKSMRRLTHGARDTDASWSPSGREIVFVREPKGFVTLDKVEIYVVSVEGRSLRRLTRNGHSEHSPAWRPARADRVQPSVVPPAAPPANSLPKIEEPPLPALSSSPPPKPFRRVVVASPKLDLLRYQPSFMPLTQPTIRIGC